MALNWTMLNPDRSPVPLPHELILRTVSAADLSLSIPNAPPTSTSSGGGSGGEKKLQGNGRVWLTDHRFIFVVNTSPNTPPGSTVFESLSVPLTSMMSTKFEQPFLGQNYLVIEIKPSPDGGLTSGTKAELRFRDKGMFEFASTLEKARERFIYMRRQSADEEEGLPGYSTPSEAGPSGTTPVPGEAPPGYDAPAYEP